MKTGGTTNLEDRGGKGERPDEATLDSRKLKREHATTIARLIGIYAELEIDPSDLISKLEGFRCEYPDLNKKLIDLLVHMEAADKAHTS